MDFLEKFDSLPESVRNMFASNEPRLALERACFMYGINEDNMDRLAPRIAQIFLGEIQLSQFPLFIAREFNTNENIAKGIAYEIAIKIFVPLGSFFVNISKVVEEWNFSKATPLVAEDIAHKRLLEIEPWILEEEKEKQKQIQEVQSKTEMLALTPALEKYPNLGEQQVSINMLKLPFFQALARPSIKNWISDYHAVLGAGKHNSVERGNYLFRSENGKKLTPAERQKLSDMFKSLDEETPLAIDPVEQKIVFGFEGGREGEGGIGLPKIAMPQMRVIEEEEIPKAKPSEEDLAFSKKEELGSSTPKSERELNSPSQFQFRDHLEEKLAGEREASQRPKFFQAFGKKNNEPEEDVFERYSSNAQSATVKKSFSPDLASMPTIKVDKQKIAEEQAQFQAEVGPRNSTYQSEVQPLATPKIEDRLNFSSPQKFASEMTAEKSTPKPESVAPQSAAPSFNAFHIAPQKYFNEDDAAKNDGDQSVARNVVDLRR
ncbi:MAG TPA: hypothetical protein VF817_02185 [Patescibacteria group bacterium]